MVLAISQMNWKGFGNYTIEYLSIILPMHESFC